MNRENELLQNFTFLCVMVMSSSGLCDPTTCTPLPQRNLLKIVKTKQVSLKMVKCLDAL